MPFKVCSLSLCRMNGIQRLPVIACYLTLWSTIRFCLYRLFVELRRQHCMKEVTWDENHVDWCMWSVLYVFFLEFLVTLYCLIRIPLLLCGWDNVNFWVYGTAAGIDDCGSADHHYSRLHVYNITASCAQNTNNNDTNAIHHDGGDNFVECTPLLSWWFAS